MICKPAPRATAVALVLLAAPACRGCVVDDPTYAGDGGAPPATSSIDVAAATGTGGQGSTTSTGGPGSTASAGGEGGGGTTGSSAAAGGGGATATGTGGAPAGCPRDDDFDEGIVFDTEDDTSCWSLMNGGLATITFDGGAVQVSPDPETGWFDGAQGVFVHQEVTGDFTATLHVVTATTAGGQYQLAGFLLRDPGSNQEAWIKSEVGKNMTIDTSDYVGLTVDGDTVIAGNSGDGIGSATLGVCRRGDAVYLASDAAGSWVIYQGGVPYTPGAPVPDLPDTIQLGFNAAASLETFVATVDDFRFASGGGSCAAALEALWPTR